MNHTILWATFFVELALVVLRFLAMHLRSAAHDRRLRKLPEWPLVPYKFGVDYLQQGSDDDKVVVIPPKFRIPRPRVK